MKKLIDIENLVIWAFQTEQATLHDACLDVTAGYPQDCIVRCEKVSVLGGFITGTSPGARFMAADSHHDAVTVVDVMARMVLHDARLVRDHGRAGTRPDWRPDARHRFEPREWIIEDSGERSGASEICPLDDRETKWRGRGYCPDAGKTVRIPRPVWVPVVEHDHPEVLRSARANYIRWWMLLDQLRQDLDGSLSDWRLSEIMPDRDPWTKEITKLQSVPLHGATICGVDALQMMKPIRKGCASGLVS